MDHGQVVLGRRRPARPFACTGSSGLEPLEGNLVALEEPQQLRARRLRPVSDDHRARRRRLRRQTLQPARSAHPVTREPADLLRNTGRNGGDGVKVLRLEPGDARFRRGAESGGKHRPERDRDLAEDLAGAPVADDALDSVDELRRLDVTLEQREERALVAFARGVLAREQRDVGRGPRDRLALVGVEVREDRDRPDLFCRHHRRNGNDRTPLRARSRKSSSLCGVAAPVQRDQELELTIDSLAFGGNGVARLDGFVVFVRRGLPGDTVRARVTKVQRRHAEAIATEVLVAGPAAGRCAVRALPGLRRLPLPGSRLRRAARGEGAVGRRLAAAARRPRRAAARADRPGGVTVRLPQQDGVLVHATRGRADARPAPGRPLGRGARDRALLADHRPRQRDPQPDARLGARGEARRLRPGDAGGLPPAPRRARGAQHRPGARAARDGARRALRPRAPDRGADRDSRGARRSTGR